jgi:hypothetical protein
MSARKQIEPLPWNPQASAAYGLEPAGELGLGCVGHGQPKRAAITPLLASQANGPEGEAVEPLRGAGVAASEQSEHWRAQREVLRGEIKRGRECLEETERELVSLRNRLEEWPAYERICGRNPLQDYMQVLAAKERIAQFLPGWLTRREAQLRVLSAQLERCLGKAPMVLAESPPSP